MKRPTIKASVSDEFLEAVRQWCADNEKEIGQETRRMWAGRIGRPEFANEKKMGRPKADQHL